MDVINQLVLNECYLDNIEKYKYISVIDIDEAVIAKKMPEMFTLTDNFKFMLSPDIVETLNSKKDTEDPRLKCDRYESSNVIEKKSTFENYVEEVAREIRGIKQANSFFFNQGYFLHSRVIDDLFAGFERVVLTNRSGDEANYNYSIPVVDKHNRRGEHAFSFTITGRKEYEYAMNMFKVYKHVLGPYLATSGELIRRETAEYDRFFAIVGDLNNFALGKSVHSTEVTFDFSLHFYDTVMNETSFMIEDRHHALLYTYVPYELGYLSHFRHKQCFEYKSVPFRQLFFDFNYFNCYFRPILEKSISTTTNA
jgi:hypothetical protein